jgi:flagellar basal-body rod protein FlgB
MKDTFPFDSTYTTLSSAVGVAARRHSVIASNIANLDTVGYRPKELDFQEALNAVISKNKGKLAKTSEKHYSHGPVSPMTGRDVESADPFNPDPVNIDTEMNNLVDNNLRFKTSVEMLIRKMKILNNAMDEGGR